MGSGDGGWEDGRMAVWRVALAFGSLGVLFCFPVVRALCTTPKHDLHLYVVLRTSSRKVKPSKSQ